MYGAYTEHHSLRNDVTDKRTVVTGISLKNEQPWKAADIKNNLFDFVIQHKSITTKATVLSVPFISSYIAGKLNVSNYLDVFHNFRKNCLLKKRCER